MLNRVNLTQKVKMGGKQKGASLLEVVIGIAIIVSAVIAAFFYYGIAMRVAEQSTNKVQAALLLSEGAEAVRVIRDNDWNEVASLSEGQEHYLEFDGTTWKATTTPETIDGKYSRVFEISPVHRDSNDDIVLSGGTLDEDTKQITVTVSWQQNNNQFGESFSIYIANIFE